MTQDERTLLLETARVVRVLLLTLRMEERPPTVEEAIRLLAIMDNASEPFH
jgi:hypothetical protein